MFLKNSVGVGGSKITSHQIDEIQANAPFHKKIWILDNHKIDKNF